MEESRQSFGGEEAGLLGRSADTKLKLSQEHFLVVGPESKQAEKTESMFGCKQLASSGGLRLKSGEEMFGRGGDERRLGEILRTERQVGGERLGTETPLGERQLPTERLSRVAFNEDRLGIKAKLSVDETGVLSRY